MSAPPGMTIVPGPEMCVCTGDDAECLGRTNACPACELLGVTEPCWHDRSRPVTELRSESG